METKSRHRCGLTVVGVLAIFQGLSSTTAGSAPKLKDTASPTLETSAYAPDPAKLSLCKYRWDEKFGRYIHGGYLSTPLDINSLMQPVMPMMQRFQQALALNGTKLVVMPVSPDYTVYSSLWAKDQKSILLSGFDPQVYADGYRNYELGLAKMGIPSVDVFNLAKQSEKLGKAFYFRWDRHWNSDGAELAGRQAARVIQTAFPSLISTFPAAAFKFEPQDSLAVNGGILNDELNTCGVKKGDIQAIKDAQQEHTRLNKAVAVQDSGLLGDPYYPVVVAGTSLSRLSGSSAVAVPLAQALNTNVLDVSVVAGGPFGSLLWYFGKEQAWNARPKIVVWESEANGEAPISTAGFRQLIPAVYGPCTGQSLLASDTVPLKGKGFTTVLHIPKGQKISGHHYYLSLNSNDPTLVKFNVNFVDIHGHSDVVSIDRTTRVPNNGVFFLEFGDSSVQPTDHVELQTFEASSAVIKTTLCHDPL